METTKLCIYGMVVAGYFAAGILDLVGHHWKSGTTAIGFGILNIVIFFWRT